MAWIRFERKISNLRYAKHSNKLLKWPSSFGLQCMHIWKLCLIESISPFTKLWLWRKLTKVSNFSFISYHRSETWYADSNFFSSKSNVYACCFTAEKKSFVQRRVTAIRIFFFVPSHVICRCEILVDLALLCKLAKNVFVRIGPSCPLNKCLSVSSFRFFS